MGFPSKSTFSLPEIFNFVSMQKTILITGANGLLGQKLVDKLSKRDVVRLIAVSRGDNRNPNREGYTYRNADITQREAVTALYKEFKPDAVINTAAMTHVDKCEDDKEGCDKINVEAVQILSDLCAEYDCRLIHVSTDFIFDGKDGPYVEKATPNPLSYYGESKLRSEKLIEESGIDYAIVRTILIYGIVAAQSRSNVVLWAKGALEKGEKISVVNDQFRSPTLAEDLAEGIILIVMKDKSGIFHVSGPEVMSMFELVQRVADFFGLDKSLISEIDTATLGQKAPRPPKTGFVILKAQTELGYRPRNFEEGLRILKEQLPDHAV